MNERVSMHGHWSSRMAFILAVTGSAVGLGNIWKFPYIAGENGGGLFVLLYLFFVFGIGLPVMMSEVLIGRRGRRNPVDTMRILGEEEAGQGWWQVVGWNGILAGFLILSFYSVIAGWSLAYVWKSMSGAFAGASAEEVGAVFADLTGSAPRLIAWHTIFMGMTIFVVARGVQYGLERAVRILMPALLFLLLVLFVYSARSGGFAQGWSFLFDFGHSELTWNGVLIALGHAFFTLSVGMGAVMAYGAYLPEGTPIATTTVSVVFADTAIALLAGLVIFPIVFVNGLDPAAGPGLIFKTLPLAFGQMPGGVLFATLFFVLLSFAAWTSSIGLLEPAAAWAVERFNTTRNMAAWMLGVVIWAIGLLSALSFNVLSEVKFFKGNFFENIDYVGSNIMLPLGGLGITVFAGWVMCRNATAEELDIGTGGRYRTWRALARFVAPVGIALVFMNAIGFLSFG